MITVINRQRKIPLDERWIKMLIKEVLRILEYEDFSIGVLVTTNATIRRYNETYRHKTGPTDILSFPYYQELSPDKRIEVPSGEEKYLGDLILSPEYIQHSAADLGVSFEHRLMILIIHSICHLLGYDHETDEQYALMQSREDDILEKLPVQLRR